MVCIRESTTIYLDQANKAMSVAERTLTIFNDWGWGHFVGWRKAGRKGDWAENSGGNSVWGWGWGRERKGAVKQFWQVNRQVIFQQCLLNQASASCSAEEAGAREPGQPKPAGKQRSSQRKPNTARPMLAALWPLLRLGSHPEMLPGHPSGRQLPAWFFQGPPPRGTRPGF